MAKPGGATVSVIVYVPAGTLLTSICPARRSASPGPPSTTVSVPTPVSGFGADRKRRPAQQHRIGIGGSLLPGDAAQMVMEVGLVRVASLIAALDADHGVQDRRPLTVTNAWHRRRWRNRAERRSR